jgi:hypothetical protein
VVAHARPAARRADGGAGLEEDVQVARLHGLAVHLTGGRDHQQARAGLYPPAAQYLGRGGQVLKAAVGAGADEGQVDLPAGDGRQRLHVVDGMWAGDHGLEGVELKRVSGGVLRAFVRVQRYLANHVSEWG